MPAAGTKAIEIEGERKFLPAADVELDELIAEGVAAQRLYDEAKERLAAVRERAVTLAEARRAEAPTTTIHLQAPRGGLATITFAQKTEVDDTAVAALEEGIPKAVFAKLFETVRSFKLRRGVQAWLKLPQGAELEKVKARIAATIRVVPKGTTVKFFGSEQKAE